ATVSLNLATVSLLFFFQAEDGIRDGHVTGVQTCALPICLQALAIETAEGCAEWVHRRIREDWGFRDPPGMTMAQRFTSRYRGKRSEERRVGKECRWRGWPGLSKKKPRSYNEVWRRVRP